MSPYFIIIKGKLKDVHACKWCLCLIPAEGLCSTCAKLAQSVSEVVQVSVPIKRLINPEDLR